MVASDTKHASLLEDIRKARAIAASNAFGRERWFRGGGYLAVILTALASSLGFVSQSSLLKSYITIEPWMISFLTASGAGIEIFRHKTTWRDAADAYYGHRDSLDRLISRLKYELPDPPTPDQVARIASDYQRAKAELGNRLYEINQREKQGYLARPQPAAPAPAANVHQPGA